MATSGLLNAINAVLAFVGEIPYNWGDVASDRNRPAHLFQLVRMWNNQVDWEQKGSGYTFAKPACFLELCNMGMTQFADGVTYSEYIWRLHLIDYQLDAGNELDMDQNLQVIAYRDTLKSYLVGFQPPQCSTMFAVDEAQDYSHNNVYHYTLDMKSGFTDTKGSDTDPDQTKVIYTGPPTEAQLNIGFEEPPAPVEDPLELDIIVTVP